MQANKILHHAHRLTIKSPWAESKAPAAPDASRSQSFGLSAANLEYYSPCIGGQMRLARWLAFIPLLEAEGSNHLKNERSEKAQDSRTALHPTPGQQPNVRLRD